MVKICHLSSAHKNTDIRILKKECVSLAKEGHEVYVIAKGVAGEYEGVHLRSVGVHSNSTFERLFRYTKKIYEEGLKVDADIYHLHDPDLLPYGIKLLKKGKKVIYDSHEDFAYIIRTRKSIPYGLRNISALVYTLYEKYSLKKFSALISVTPAIVARLKKFNPKTIMITNYPIINDEIIKSKNNYSKEVCYAGGILKKWNHHNTIKALELCKDVNYILCGNVPKEYLEEIKLLPKWSNVDYKGLLNHSDVYDTVKNASAGMALLSYDKNLGTEGTLGNTKIFEYMIMGIPVICTNFTLWRNIVDKYNCGICVNPNDVEGIANAIEYLVNNPKVAEKMGENGKRAVVEMYNWKSQETILNKLYQDLICNQKNEYRII